LAWALKSISNQKKRVQDRNKRLLLLVIQQQVNRIFVSRFVSISKWTELQGKREEKFNQPRVIFFFSISKRRKIYFSSSSLIACIDKR
jgi:hypothetical protein